MEINFEQVSRTFKKKPVLLFIGGGALLAGITVLMRGRSSSSTSQEETVLQGENTSQMIQESKEVMQAQIQNNSQQLYDVISKDLESAVRSNNEANTELYSDLTDTINQLRQQLAKQNSETNEKWNSINSQLHEQQENHYIPQQPATNYSAPAPTQVQTTVKGSNLSTEQKERIVQNNPEWASKNAGQGWSNANVPIEFLN